MTHLRTTVVLAVLAVFGFAAPTPGWADPLPGDAARVLALALELEAAADEGYRLCRSDDDGTRSRLAQTLRRLRVQTRRLQADLDAGRSPAELEPVVLGIRALVRDVAEESSESFASEPLARTNARLQQASHELVASLTPPAGAPRNVAFGSGW